MHRPHRLGLALSCVCWVGAAACGSEPGTGESVTSTGPANETGATGTGTGTEVTGATADVTSAATEADSTTSTTAGDASTGVPTTGEPTASGTTASDTTVADPTTDGDTTIGVDTSTDDTTIGGDTSTTDDSTSTGDEDLWDCANGKPVTVDGRGKYDTLAAAIAAAPPGATITVCPGTYQETVIVDRPMTLIGAGQDKTFLDGGDTGTPLLIKQVSVTITGFTFQHGKAEHNVLGNGVCGGALAIRHSAEPMLVAVTDCSFVDNHGQYGGAICYDGGGNNDTTDLTLENVKITGNSADVNGGGIFSYSNVEMTATTIVENTAGSQGGGMYFSYCDSTVDGGTVKQNTADEGGGMFLQSPVTVTVTGSDWGFGQNQENVPNDVQHFANAYGFFGADVSFFCEYIEWNMGMCALK